MVVTEEKLNRLREIIGGAPKKIALLCHTNPDGDTIGAALAWVSPGMYRKIVVRIWNRKWK